MLLGLLFMLSQVDLAELGLLLLFMLSQVVLAELGLLLLLYVISGGPGWMCHYCYVISGGPS